MGVRTTVEDMGVSAAMKQAQERASWMAAFPMGTVLDWREIE